jgi:CheY-like chemotaxis protein
VFVDFNMPDVDGYKVLAYVHCEPRLAQGPVISVTSDDQLQTSKLTMDGGTNAVIIKPVMADILEKVLKKTGIH